MIAWHASNVRNAEMSSKKVTYHLNQFVLDPINDTSVHPAEKAVGSMYSPQSKTQSLGLHKKKAKKSKPQNLN